MIKMFKKLFLLALISCAFVFYTANEAGAVRVSLKRIVFEGNKRFEVLTIINNTPKSQTYRLGWRKYRMDEDKSLQAIGEDESDEGILWADDMVRFAPRRVTIPAGGSQQVRLLFRRAADMKEAEYRSHLWIVSEVKPDQFVLKQDNEKQAIRLSIQPALSLPVFVRNGNLTASAEISNAKLYNKDGTLHASFTLEREGTKSLYGDLELTCVDGGKEVVVRQIKGIAVYTEITKRNFDYDLSFDAVEINSCQNMKILFKADIEDPQLQGAVMAEADASL